ncbi:ABC transporter ATP-binding protein [Flavihumibacter sp. R14]|nr:ABC transporter ATP-binding protein [Flavihumibacter soli]
MHSLEIKNLCKTYPNGVKAINNISLSISNGMFGLLGPNGAGKSSLMRTIAALQTPDSGTIEFDGKDIIGDPGFIRKQLGYLPQEFGVYPKVSAYRLLDHLAVLKGIMDSRQRKEQILSLLEQTNLLSHAGKAVEAFSGGMRQRFGIAQALLGDPRLIIVDEPTAGLDPEERNRFNNLLSEIGEQRIVILSTHIVEDVKDLCSDMAVIANGSVVVQGHPSSLVRSLQGKIWSRSIKREELERISTTMTLISSRLNAGQLHIHVYSDNQPGDGFMQISPDLEDVYFHTLFSANYENSIA